MGESVASVKSFRWSVLALCCVALWSCAKPPAAPKPVAAPPAQPQLSPRDLARQALAAYDKKDWAAAVPLLSRAALAYPEVAPFLRLRLAEAEAARGNVEHAVAVLSEIIAVSDTSAATDARLRLPALFARLSDRGSTDGAWQHAMQVPIDELTESDFIAMADALSNNGREDLATGTRWRLLNTYTGGRYTETLFQQLRPQIEKLSVADKVALAAKLAKADRYDQALLLLPPGSPEARSTRIRALFNSRHYTELLAETAGLRLDDPSLAMLRARAAWRDDKPQEFLAGLDALEQQFPASKEATEAKIVRAKYYTTDVVDYTRAIENLTKAIDAGALGNDGENLWNLGWTYTLAGRYPDALKVFERYIAAYPDGDWKTNSLFWSAKIYDRIGRAPERDARAAQVVAEYPYSYYAYRAKELWPNVRGVEVQSMATFPAIEVELAKVSDPRLSIVRALQDVGLDRSAAREMKAVAASYEDNPGVQFMLADAYLRGGEPFKANGVLQRRFREFVRHGGTNIPRRFWEILFPLAYGNTIQAEAQRRGLDPYLLASIIRQESGFEPSTVSNAGAVGLMQIMPEEASRIASAAGLGAVSRDDLFVPEKNIAVGAAEYAQKLAAMNGIPTLAIAAYNAGEQAVQGWVARTPLDDIDLFIESIPYAETRLYVKTVTRNRNEYRRIYQ